MGRIASALDQMSTRERALIGAMVGLAVTAVVVLTALWVGSSVSDLETRLEEDRASLEKIYARSGKYVDAIRHTEEMRALAERSKDLNLKLAVNDIAKGIQFDSRDREGNVDGSKKLSDIMQFDQTQESKLTKTKRRAKKEDESGYYRRDQPITLSDTVPFDAIYQLMERIEEANDLMFVTNVELTREFQDGRLARKNAAIVVSTYYYEDAK